MRYSLDAEVNGFCGARSRSVIGSGLARRHRTCRTIVGDGPRHGETAAKHPISAGRSRHYRARKAKRYATQRGRRRAAERYQEELGRSCPDVLRRIRVHDLKHTFGDRIRAAGVSFKDRQTLLGHKAHHVMTHSRRRLISHAEKACDLVSGNLPHFRLCVRGGPSQVLDKFGGKGGNRTLDPGIMSLSSRQNLPAWIKARARKLHWRSCRIRQPK